MTPSEHILAAESQDHLAAVAAGLAAKARAWPESNTSRASLLARYIGEAKHFRQAAAWHRAQAGDVAPTGTLDANGDRVPGSDDDLPHFVTPHWSDK